ncbi:MAG: DUF6186 family protein [Amnibacterium sp.]
MRAVTIGVFLALALAAVAATAAAHRRPDRVQGLGAVLDVVLASRAARIVVLLFWLWLGWHFFVGDTVTP